MEQRVSLITLGSADVARAAAFWEAMGWRKADDRPEMAVFDLLGQSVAIYDCTKLAADLGMEEGRLGTGLATYAYNVRRRDEVAAVLSAAEAAGGRVVKPAQDVFWGGHHGFFADPDGHLWEVAFNPGAPLSPEGAFRWDGYGAGA
jgi:uncharacterized glyoxalase superfamily protein PhnB